MARLIDEEEAFKVLSAYYKHRTPAQDSALRDALSRVPSADLVNEWCTDCKEYDQTQHCCHRFTKVIRQAQEELKQNAVPVIRCMDCIYYDPPHIENDGQRYEYKDMPPEAFDPITKKYVSVAYGINMGGRCCRDYECGYSEDKRVFVTETNYCGRAERRGEE